MAITHLAPTTHVIPLTMVRRERRLPAPGTISVRTGQHVSEVETLAEAEPEPRHFFIDIARGLGVPEREVPKHLVHEPGARIEAGEVIAGPVGISRRTLRAPANGRIVSVVGSRVLFEVSGGKFELRSGFPGTVTATDGSQSVTVETSGALIQVAWGNGQRDFGVMRMLATSPGDRLRPEQMEIDLRGAIVVGGICESSAPLHQAQELTLRGLILGSMPADLVPVALRLSFPVLLTEGFGELPICPPAYRLLSTNAGREAAVDAHLPTPHDPMRPEVIIPLPATQDLDLPGDTFILSTGMQVRVLRAPFHGAVGTIREILSQAVAFPSGVLARSATVDLEGIGTATVPLANLEILQ
jgi:hypothetical protein